MTTSASAVGPVDHARSLERVPPRLPARALGRAVALRVAHEAMPIVARSVAAGMALLAVEQAVRRLVEGAAGQLPAPRTAAAPRPYATISSYTETIVVERVRRRR